MPDGRALTQTLLFLQKLDDSDKCDDSIAPPHDHPSHHAPGDTDCRICGDDIKTGDACRCRYSNQRPGWSGKEAAQVYFAERLTVT